MDGIDGPNFRGADSSQTTELLPKYLPRWALRSVLMHALPAWTLNLVIKIQAA